MILRLHEVARSHGAGRQRYRLSLIHISEPTRHLRISYA
ncbi:hypothetical protein, partial [Pseudomonas aeruginosa]